MMKSSNNRRNFKMIKNHNKMMEKLQYKKIKAKFHLLL